MDSTTSFLGRNTSVAEAWERWEASFSIQTKAATELLLSRTPVEAGMAVLDVGSGAGEPALALSNAVGGTGRVIATDFSDEAMSALSEKARTRGYTNLETRQADMHSLPFSDATFDAVTGRLSVMFCARPLEALSEVRRVLKPGGRACFLVWGPPTQPLFASTLGAVQRRAPLPLPPAGQPGPFQFAEAGTLGEALRRAGFASVSEQTETLPWPWPGPALEMWLAFSDLSGPVLRPAFDTLPAAEQRELEAEIIAGLTVFFDGSVTDPRASVHVARGLA